MGKIKPIHFDKVIFDQIDRSSFFYMPHITIILSILFLAIKIFNEGFNGDILSYIIGIVLALISIILTQSFNFKSGYILYAFAAILGFLYYSFFSINSRKEIVLILYILFSIQCIFLLDRPHSIFFSIALFGIYSTNLLIIQNTNIRRSVEIFIFIGFITACIIEAKNWVRNLILSNMETSRETQNVTLKILGKVCEIYDSETNNHLQRVEILIQKLVKYLLDENLYTDIIDLNYYENIKSAAYLHDIGKIGISKSIITKKGSLTEEEYKNIQNHTLIGHDIIKEAADQIKGNSIYTLALDIVKHHHEKWDGTGYPDKLSGNSIPLSGRIMAIVDVFDALISNRPYKKAMELDEAVEIIQNSSGSHFDPQIVDIFVKYSDELYDSIKHLIIKKSDVSAKDSEKSILELTH